MEDGVDAVHCLFGLVWGPSLGFLVKYGNKSPKDRQGRVNIKIQHDTSDGTKLILETVLRAKGNRKKKVMCL